MKHVTLKSGAVLGLQDAEFEDAMWLLNTVLKQMIGVSLSSLSLDKVNLSELMGKDITEFKDAILKVISSTEVQEAIWKCMTSCTYQGVSEKVGTRITRETFKPRAARGDFFPACGEVAIWNLSPFFENLSLPSLSQSSPSLDAPPVSATS